MIGRTHRPRKLGKRQLERANAAFVLAVREELEAHGGVHDRSWYWILPSRVGILKGLPVASVLGPGGFVALRFEDVDRARAHLSSLSAMYGALNPYSGKWNLHLYDEEFGEHGGAAVRAALALKLEAVAVPLCRECRRPPPDGVERCPVHPEATIALPRVLRAGP